MGDGGAAPYLLAELPAGTEVLGVDVSVHTSGTAEVAYCLLYTSVAFCSVAVQRRRAEGSAERRLGAPVSR